MKPDQLKDSELDSILRNVLISDDKMTVPSDLTDTTIQRIEKKVLVRNLVMELFLKIALGIISLAVLTGVFAFIKGSGIITSLYLHFIDHWQLISSLILLSFVTIFTDQVGIKFYHSFKKG